MTQLTNLDILIPDANYFAPVPENGKVDEIANRFKQVYLVLTSEDEQHILEEYNGDRHILISRIEAIYNGVSRKAMPLCLLLINIKRYVLGKDILLWGNGQNPFNQMLIMSSFIPVESVGATRIDSIENQQCLVSPDGIFYLGSEECSICWTDSLVGMAIGKTSFEFVGVYGEVNVVNTERGAMVAIKKTIVCKSN